MKKYTRKPSGKIIRDISIEKVREIEAALKIVVAQIGVINKIIGGQIVSPKKVLQVVDDVFQVDILFTNEQGKLSQKPEYALARHAARYLLMEYTSLGVREVAIYTGAKDHSSTTNSISTMLDLMDTDSEIKAMIDKCIKKLSE